MKRISGITVVALLLLGLFGCAQSAVAVVNTYEHSGTGPSGEYNFFTYYEMSDGTWKTDDHSYQYRVEVTGRLACAVSDSTYVFLSNTEDITFEQAWKASGLSSDMSDYFDEDVAKFVGMK